MAESQIAGLFMTPEMYQRQQMQADRQRAAEYAQLAPEQRAAMGFFSAGQGLGRAVGTLLGAQDPQLQRITEQQQMLQGLDVADPDSLMQAARQASQAGNVPLAMQLAGRAQEIGANAALIDQRNRSNNPLQALLASGKYTPDSISAFAQSRNPADLVLATTPARINFGEVAERKSFELFNLPFEQLNQEQRKSVQDALAKPAQAPSFGAEAERVARELYAKGYADLTQVEQAAVNKRVDERAVNTASAGAPRVVVQPAPTKVPQDVARFRQDVAKTIEPQLKVVTATDSALAQVNEALRTNNPVAFQGARTQMARAFGGGGDLSAREIKAAGGDPSIIGMVLDTASVAFTSTPTRQQHQYIKDAATVLRRVAINRARGELDVQRTIAIRSGANPADVDAALMFPELGNAPMTPPAPAPTGGSSAPSSTFLGSVRPSASSPRQSSQADIPSLLDKYAPVQR